MNTKIWPALLPCLWATTVHADSSMKYQDWRALAGDEYQEAFTASDSGATLGVFCALATEQCFAYFRTEYDCSEGSTVPVLLNADTGSNLVETTCRALGSGRDATYVNVFQDFDLVHGVMLRARELGIAIPLDGGRFKAIRFSLMGSNEAIAVATTTPARSPQKRDAVF